MQHLLVRLKFSEEDRRALLVSKSEFAASRLIANDARHRPNGATRVLDNLSDASCRADGLNKLRTRDANGAFKNGTLSRIEMKQAPPKKTCAVV
jgi:hypothetical protein